MNDQTYGNGTSPSGWQGLSLSNPTEQGILQAPSADGQYEVQQSPDSKGGPAGSPNIGAMSSIASLIAMI